MFAIVLGSLEVVFIYKLMCHIGGRPSCAEIHDELALVVVGFGSSPVREEIGSREPVAVKSREGKVLASQAAARENVLAWNVHQHSTQAMKFFFRRELALRWKKRPL